MTARRPTPARLACCWLLLLAAMPAGCLRERSSPTASVRIANDRLGSMTIAVGPALNQSGSSDFDANRFADLMASELSLASGISVIPVSRVLAVLASQNKEHVESPEHALELLDRLGADAILVFAVTEYDPYDPPSIGITGQLYGARPWARIGALDPVELSHQPAVGSVGGGGPSLRGLLAQTQRVFDASHDDVMRDLRAFAEGRSGGRSPFGWRKFVVSQQNYIRFCCFSTISQLLGWPPESVLAAGDPREVRTP